MRQYEDHAKPWKCKLETALESALKLKAKTLLRSESETFVWPTFNSNFDGTRMESLCRHDEPESLRVKLVLFPVLMPEALSERDEAKPTATLHSKVILGS